MKKAYKFRHPIDFVGTYPDNWAGYTFLQWSVISKNWHEGVDYNGEGGGDADKGIPIFACANGIVEWQGYHKGWGWHIYIKHEEPEIGIIYSHYAHCLEKSFKCKVGDEVSVGQQIAQVGDSGWNSMFAHVHFEIRRPIGLGYDFWADPKNGWDKAKMVKYYFDPFEFIVTRKDREEPDTVDNSGTEKLENVIKDYRERLQTFDKLLEKIWDIVDSDAMDKNNTKLLKKLKSLKDNQKSDTPSDGINYMPPNEDKNWVSKAIEYLIKIRLGGDGR